jgi:type IV pilus assembly protein PilW
MLTSRIRGRRQSGLSLVELLVGIAVGMFIVAAAAMLVVTQLTDNRRMLLEVQVQQDLRATADIITRELRRAGSIAFLSDAPAYVWKAGENWVPNPYMAVTPASGADLAVTFSSSRTLGTSGPYGFRLNNGVIESRLPEAGWQQLTDSATLFVTDFSVTSQHQPAIRVACSKVCADGSQTCWPTVTVRAYEISITGRATSDAAVRRSIRSVARLRNDQVVTDAALGTRSCPA